PVADLMRGVLLTLQSRTFEELNHMSDIDVQNTLIRELVGRTNQSTTHFQQLDVQVLTGAGVALVFLRQIKPRTDAQLKTISDDDQRNLLIIAIGAQTGLPIPHLQTLSSLELVTLGLGPDESFIRGVLLAGGFQTFEALNPMSRDDRRKALTLKL